MPADAPSTIVYEDLYGDIIVRPGRRLVELRWFDSTAALTGTLFNHWLSTFADAVAEARQPFALIDAVQFAMPRGRMDGAWRLAHVVPRYNAAGLQRLAFVVPPDAPGIGEAPWREGPATYLTAYFDRRQPALRWLA